MHFDDENEYLLELFGLKFDTLMSTEDILKHNNLSVQ